MALEIGQFHESIEKQVKQKGMVPLLIGNDITFPRIIGKFPLLGACSYIQIAIRNKLDFKF